MVRRAKPTTVYELQAALARALRAKRRTKAKRIRAASKRDGRSAKQATVEAFGQQWEQPSLGLE
jgi:hypothetical protein